MDFVVPVLGVLPPQVKNYYDTGLTVPDSGPTRVMLANAKEKLGLAYFEETKCNNSCAGHFQVEVSCDTITENTSFGAFGDQVFCKSKWVAG